MFGGVRGRLFAALAAINVAGIAGVGWFLVGMLVYDSVLVLEISIGVALLAVMALVTGGGFALARRGKLQAATILLAVAALPTLAVYGCFVYLDTQPIDWR